MHTASHCPNPWCRDGRVLVTLAEGAGVAALGCASCRGLGRGDGGGDRRANAPAGARRVNDDRRRNPPRGVPVRQFSGRQGHLVGSSVLAIEYEHAQSHQDAPYRHDFDSEGVEMWALADGSILLRHPRHRLWDDYVVSDSE